MSLRTWTVQSEVLVVVHAVLICPILESAPSSSGISYPHLLYLLNLANSVLLGCHATAKNWLLERAQLSIVYKDLQLSFASIPPIWEAGDMSVCFCSLGVCVFGSLVVSAMLLVVCYLEG